MKGKIFWLSLLGALAFFVLWLRLFELQVIKGKENEELASENRLKIINIAAGRGVIYDREGRLLVRNRPEGRQYLYGQVLAPVLGYIGEVSQEELKDSLLKLGDVVGKQGLEKQYDKVLRGEDGGLLVETDAAGQPVREIKKKESVEGKSINLTLDLGLQQKAMEVLAGRKGVIIASDPKTGEILALASSPSFDPNLFTIKNQLKHLGGGRMDSSEVDLQDILNDPNQPMFNRAIAGLYPPGSIFKIVTSIAGLEEGKISKDTLIEDTGVIEIETQGKKYSYANWYFTQSGQKEGMLDLVKAIQRSNDIYFYQAGERVGIRRLAEWAHFLGLGEPLGIDLPGEAGGLIPTPEWKKEVKTENWYLGDTYITSIGQGNLLLTPLQVHELPSIIASGGKFCVPHLVNKDLTSFTNTDKRSLMSFGNFCQDLKIKKENLDLIKEGMIRACGSKGTTSIFADFKVEVACKTGTAEIGDPQKKTHAWFTVFAPWDKPEIVVTVLLEKAGEGSKEAAPLAKKILEYWFTL